MNLSGEKKFLIGVVIVTIALVIGGVVFLSRGSAVPTGTGEVSSESLVQNAVHTIGKQEAPVEIVEFADFQCPACKASYPIIKTVLENNKDKVYFVFRFFPLPLHSNARAAAAAAESAGKQNKFWEMHDRLFETQTSWESSDRASEIFEGYATELGLNIDQYKLDRDKANDAISSDVALGNSSGVNSTPTFFVNGQRFPGSVNLESMQKLIDAEVAKNGTSK